MEVLGYIGALLMGLALGLIGGGGSILTLPILVYLFGVDKVLATAYSLFIVGVTAVAGSASHVRLGNVHWRTALLFGAPSIAAVWLTRSYLVPALPDPLFRVGAHAVGKGTALLLLFALLMIPAAWSMIRGPKSTVHGDAAPNTSNILIPVEGLVVGTLTGLVGAGGGFLIIPALVLLAKLPMKQAVGTSLVIIAAKSLIGFTGDLLSGTAMAWPFLLGFSAMAVIGIVAGSALSKRVANEQLKPAFGWAVLVMGLGMIAGEVWG